MDKLNGIEIGKPKIPNPLDLVKRDLVEMRSELINKAKNSDEDKKKEIIDDIGELEHFVEIIANVHEGVDKINKKYGWDK